MAEEWVDPGRRTYLPHLGVDPIRFSLRQSPRVGVCMGTDVAIPNLESAVFCANESEELVSCLFVTESTQHRGRYCRGVLLFDPTHHHAEMSRFNNYPNAKRMERRPQSLQASGVVSCFSAPAIAVEHIDQARNFVSRIIFRLAGTARDVNLAEKMQKMMFG